MLRFFHSSAPVVSPLWAAGILRARLNISASACSAVESVLASAVFMTRMPFSVAVGRWMLSTPTPARAIARSLPGFSRTLAVTFTPERTIKASYAPTVAANFASSFRSRLTSKSAFCSLRYANPSSASLSATRIR